jgi:hypothetical protein
MGPMPRLLSLLRFLVVLAMVFPGVAFAATTGVLKGTAIDEGGLPIPGVLITLESDKIMGGKQMETDADGRFQFIELLPGNYELLAEKAGFAKVRRTNLLVATGRTANLTIEMKLAVAGAEIVVEEKRPVVDTESGGRSSVLTKEFLERIPAGRDYQSAVQMAAGVTGGSNANIGGAASNENTYMLDGVNITDPVTGTFSLNFNFDAIEQIEVLTSAFDPENDGLGGSINVVTESGGNTLEVETAAYYTNGAWGPKLDARYAADGTEMAPTDFDSQYSVTQIGVKITGPIIRDKAWFIASYQATRSVIANVGIDLPRDYEGHYALGKLTWQPNASHRFQILAQTNPTTIDNIDQDDRFVKPEAQGRQAQGGYVVSGRWNWFISPDAFLETQATVQKLFIEQYGVPCTHNQDLGYHPCEPDELENSIDFTTPGRFGVNQAFDSDNWIFYLFDDRWRSSLSSKFNLLQVDFLGSHDFKVGADASYLGWSQTLGITGNQYYYDLNELYYNPDTLQNYYWIETTGPINFTTSAFTLGTFIQDVYKPIDNLTFRYGLRYDRSIFRNDVGDPILNVGMFAPRLSIIWDPWSDGKTKLVGSAGRFYDSGRFAVADYLSQSGFGQKLQLGEYFNEFTSDASSQYIFYPLENTNTISEDTIAPRADEFLVGGEREIIKDLAAQLYFDGKFTRNLYAFDETNLVWDEQGYNVLGSSDGSLNGLYRLRTPNIARRDYFRTDVGFTKLFSDRWEAQATYSYTVSRGTVQTAPSAFLAVAPQVEYYVNGLLFTDVTHDVAGGVAWDIPNDPWTTRLGATFFFESGNPETRYYSNASYYGSSAVLYDTVGTYAREEAWWTLNLLLQQKIPVRKGGLWGVVQVDNVTNNRAGQSASVSGDNRWIISSRQDPLQASIGARYEF